MAEVTIVLDNSVALLPCDYDEVSITRRLFPFPESQYLIIINQEVRLKDVETSLPILELGQIPFDISLDKVRSVIEMGNEGRRAVTKRQLGCVKSIKIGRRKLSAILVDTYRSESRTGT